jgi:hypothetical protein
MPKVLNKRLHGVPPGAILVDRTTPYGNPFKMYSESEREKVCNEFEAWAPSLPKFDQYLRELQGKNLVCHCAPKRCHADAWLRWANA